MVVILTFKNLLETNKDARRIFGKRELEIMLRQLDGIALKQSEKNRLSRDIRPKLEFIKQINEFRDSFRLKKNQVNKDIIKRALDTILNHELSNNIDAVLLFGSFADNTYTKRSDIDICVVFKEDLSLSQATLFRIQISGTLPEKVDVQVFNTLPQKIKRDIARNHRVLFKNNNFDNINFSIRFLKEQDYFLRMQRIFGVEA